ncbi:hypothetical protein IDH44_16985 [Paenibacillus sp. IB182496]|uniref:Copper amine oxidase-like N-terminal domain-containing protein n=1 Tax=Paenibacillus sabuli TaxID=2772509 RepID=A0A927BWT0_9BACL|nr:hypothetical protein [Paenibacillus sabuli]MBD2846894.1 hypothetical protein [Paenibacillus sabuli]
MFFLLSASAIAAGETIRALVFDGRVIVNNRIHDGGEEGAPLYANGHVYVPVRELARQMDGYTSYDPGSRTVYIDQPASGQAKASVHAADQNESLKLRLFSAQSTYAIGEPLRVWATLANTGGRRSPSCTVRR